ncbi:MAG: hypothetical protein K0Q51_1385 [Rickettsiaceae bacterium]|jgi:SAM-dependent methyltransferase|nr:hypothetical protein [Rickettsiaceae bacterium]
MHNHTEITLPKATHVYGIRGDDSLLDTIHINISIPEENKENKKIATLNKTGFMTTDMDCYTKKFIQSAAKTKHPVLDIGAAYGLASIPAVMGGATVIANDIDPRHLLLLREQIPPSFRENLYLKQGYFPEKLDFPEESLEAIIICRVAHFFSSAQIQKSLKKIYKWLIPGGKLYWVMMTQYHHILIDKFAPIYEQRWASGVRWPGMISNMHEYASHLSDKIPQFLHVCDTRPMSIELIKQGFIIEEMSMFDYERPEQKVIKSGREYLGFIASKPL